MKLELKGEELHVRAQTDTIKFVTLPLMFSRELNIWSWLHIIVVHRWWRNWQKAQCACKTVALLWKLGAFWPSRCGNLFRSLIKHVYREIRGRASSQAACTFLIFHINWIRIKMNWGKWCPCSCIGSPSHYSGSVYGSCSHAHSYSRFRGFLLFWAPAFVSKIFVLSV